MSAKAPVGGCGMTMMIMGTVVVSNQLSHYLWFKVCMCVRVCAGENDIDKPQVLPQMAPEVPAYAAEAVYYSTYSGETTRIQIYHLVTKDIRACVSLHLQCT